MSRIASKCLKSSVSKLNLNIIFSESAKIHHAAALCWRLSVYLLHLERGGCWATTLPALFRDFRHELLRFVDSRSVWQHTPRNVSSWDAWMWTGDWAKWLWRLQLSASLSHYSKTFLKGSGSLHVPQKWFSYDSTSEISIRQWVGFNILIWQYFTCQCTVPVASGRELVFPPVLVFIFGVFMRFLRSHIITPSWNLEDRTTTTSGRTRFKAWHCCGDSAKLMPWKWHVEVRKQRWMINIPVGSKIWVKKGENSNSRKNKQRQEQQQQQHGQPKQRLCRCGVNHNQSTNHVKR